ncbi:MAG: hypothetical protein KJ767_02935 [Nanoarchaeota archaeon]|nr:hypothetical protein [Nanoarchaeota archaeon]
MPKEKESLEERIRKLEKSIKIPSRISLDEFISRVKRVIRKFDPDFEEREAKHSKGKIITFLGVDKKPHKIVICEGKFSKNEASPGVSKETIEELSDGLNIPENYLELYTMGHGKVYKRIKKEIEGEYGI